MMGMGNSKRGKKEKSGIKIVPQRAQRKTAEGHRGKI
jgi:hypothetical protein